MGMKPPFRYQPMLMVLLSLNFGIVFLDRNAMSYLGPFVQKDLQLNNSQIGLLASAFSIAWGLSGYFGAALIDRSGHRKRFLVVATMIFSVCSVLSAWATSFVMLLGSRVLMGLFEGPINPVQQAVVVAESSPERRGFNMGLVQNFGTNVFGNFLAPLAMGTLAVAYGWRSAFLVAAVPGLVMALLLGLLVREPRIDPAPPPIAEHRMPVRKMLRIRNIQVAILISIFLVPWIVLGWTFLPLVYANLRHLDPASSSWLMAMLGVSGILGTFILPGLSDRIGRKPVVIVGTFLGASVPLAALYWGGSIWGLGAIVFTGWLATGAFPIFMATIPSESVPAAYVATICGLVQGIGEIVGSGGGAWLAGKAADEFGLQAAMWIMAACAMAGGLISLMLIETAPARVRALSLITSE